MAETKMKKNTVVERELEIEVETERGKGQRDSSKGKKGVRSRLKGTQAKRKVESHL